MSFEMLNLIGGLMSGGAFVLIPLILILMRYGETLKNVYSPRVRQVAVKTYLVFEPPSNLVYKHRNWIISVAV